MVAVVLLVTGREALMLEALLASTPGHLGRQTTCRKQERDVFETLRALFACQPVSFVVEGQVVTICFKKGGK